jgi:branched-chain amino acid transport system permease protein
VSVQALINGAAIGGVYAIFALGYTLVFSIIRVINFAHGAVFTIGAYVSYSLTGASFGFNGLLAQAALPIALPFPVALLGGGLAAGLLSVLLELVAFRPLRRRGADSLLTLVLSLGLAVAIVNGLQYLVGAEIYTFPSDALGDLPAAVTVFGARVRTVQLVILAVSLLMVAALTWLIRWTRTGAALTALSQDATTARLLGISVDRLVLLSFFLSGFLGGVAGTLVGLSVSIAGPYFGIAFALKGLAVIVLGGLGDIPGAVVAGLLIGVGEALVPSEFVAYRDMVAFVLLFLVLLLRPQGLLGRAAIKKV